MNARISSVVQVTLLACCFPGCSQTDTVDISAVPEVEVALNGELVLDDEPLATVGRNDTLPGHALHLVQTAVILPRNVLALSHEGSQSILYFDSTGGLLREVGRYGDGPGEFNLIRSLHRLDAGALAAWDVGQKRLTIIGPDGHVVSTISLGAGNEKLRAQDLYNLGADEFVVVSIPHRTGRPAMRSFREELAVAIVDTTGAVSAEIEHVPGDEWFGPLQPLFGYKFFAAATLEAFYVGDGREPDLTEYDSNATAARRLRLPLERKPLGADEWQAVRDGFLARRVKPDDRRMITDLLNRSHNVDSFPAYTDLISASDGALWVREYGAHDVVRRWLVIDTTRTAAREITLPADSKLLYATADRVVLLFSDEMDREYVQVYGFEPVPTPDRIGMSF